ncbi:hypothetical protein FOZ63_006614, partial [Perkinsus olseni]
NNRIPSIWPHPKFRIRCFAQLEEDSGKIVISRNQQGIPDDNQLQVVSARCEYNTLTSILAGFHIHKEDAEEALEQEDADHRSPPRLHWTNGIGKKIALADEIHRQVELYILTTSPADSIQ